MQTAGDVNVTAAVLRCPQCNKPFDKPASLKRHGYYCRSRQGTSTTRARSCIVCAASKTRCDHQRPACSRCVARKLGCRYPPVGSSGRGKQGRGHGVGGGGVGNADAVSSGAALVVASGGAFDGGQGMELDEGFAGLTGEGFSGMGDWHGGGVDFLELGDLQRFDEVGYGYAPGLHDLAVSMQAPVSTPDVVWIPRPMSNPRKLVLRRDHNKGKQRIADLILRTLRSYPLMMVRHSKLPPFIHAEFAALDLEGVSLESLMNCIGLMRMIGGSVRGSRKLFWKNVGLECERIRAEYMNFNKWETLMGMQALSVYLLMRVNEGETDDNNVDTSILMALNGLTQNALKFRWECSTTYANCLYGGQMAWADWVFEESRRRLSALFRIVGMLVYLDPTTVCDLQPDLVIAPLPSKKELWEASTQASWRVEAQKEFGSPVVYGLANDGELLEIQAGKTFCAAEFGPFEVSGETGEGRRIADWEEWCLGMDGFGGLIMLAASLVG